MTRLKHVLILTILILPMFALAPTLVTSPNEVLTNRVEADTSIPALSVEETLRVAVYAEDNTTLPAYSMGGVPTDHYTNVINLLQTAGLAVTALTTQDILDYKLMVADFDVFVLPNQLPRESIINPIKDYWLGGGGILNFGHSVGFCFYAGIIDPVYEGADQIGAEWIWTNMFPNITIEDRHPVTKAYDAGDRFVQTGNMTFFNPDVSETTSDRFIPLGVNDLATTAWNLWALDNPNRGGRFVHLPGNCSVISNSLEPIIIDAVDWLTPRPKGKILFDLTHNPYVSVDLWDPYSEYYPMMSYRDGLVNHTYTVDKLHTDITLSKLAQYDLLIVPISNDNFTATEVEMIRTWVQEGGSLFVFADTPFLVDVAAVADYLISPYDISVNLTAGSSGFAGTAVPSVDLHPLHENALYLEVGDSSYLNITGDGYPLWFHDSNIVGAAQEYGEGRVIVSSDMNMACDGLEILFEDNYNYLLNVANWLTAATADVLFYVTNPTLVNPYHAPAVDALNALGIPFYITSSNYYMDLSLQEYNWNLVILDSPWPGIGGYLDEISAYMDTGGDLIVSWHQVDSYSAHPIFAKIGFESALEYPDKEPFYIWDSGHGIFNHPNDYGAMNFTAFQDYGDEGDLLSVYPNATALAGYTDTNNPGNASIVLGFDGHVIFNAYLIDQLTGDVDDSTYSDNYELWQNEIAFLYYDRPTINHPDDVTYMETETGNEISWAPFADAGPWEYVVRENGSIIESGHWGGSTITINVDGVNASITEYQLTVFDRLGYSVSDSVDLNVTEFVDISTSTGGGAGDSTLLIIIVAAAAGAVIIIIIVIQLKKKK